MLMDPVMGPGGMPTTSSSVLMGGRDLLGYRIGRATAAQKQLAEAKAQEILARDTVKRQVAKSKQRHVAVAVEPTPDQRAKQKKRSVAVIKIDTRSGKAEDDVFSPEGGAALKSGKEIQLGGDPTLFFATSGDDI